MARRLPPFPALLAFEAAARHLSFTLAADELCLTQSAVSHRIRKLEAFLGAALFERTPTGVHLTTAGRRYQAGLGRLLDRIEEATASVSGDKPSGRLTILSTPGCAARWLMPRLDRFTGRHPEIEPAIVSSIDHPIGASHFTTGDVDVILQWGADPIPGVLTEPFLSSGRVAVASPDLLAAHPPVTEAADLLRLPLIHDLIGDGWPDWFALAGVTGGVTGGEAVSAAIGGPRVAHCNLAMAAALSGQGVALAWTALAEAEIEAGRLAVVHPLRLPERLIYSVACLESRARLPKIAAFRAWVRDEVGQAESPVQAAE